MGAQQPFLTITAAARPGFAARFVRMMTAAWRLWDNRRAMRRLSELSDHELRDIGLEREDIARAYDGPILNDPVRRLEQIVRQRDRVDSAIRRRP